MSGQAACGRTSHAEDEGGVVAVAPRLPDEGHAPQEADVPSALSPDAVEYGEIHRPKPQQAGPGRDPLEHAMPHALDEVHRR